MQMIPIVEGTDPDELESGVGHMSQTAWPGEKKTIKSYYPGIVILYLDG